MIIGLSAIIGAFWSMQGPANLHMEQLTKQMESVLQYMKQDDNRKRSDTSLLADLKARIGSLEREVYK